jgi:hypothetical protein
VLCAVVVDVLALLDLAGVRTAAPAAFHEPGERMLPFRVLKVVSGGEDALSSFEQLA